MSITLDLAPDVAADLERLAERYGSVEAAVETLVRRAVGAMEPQSGAADESDPSGRSDLDSSPRFVRVGPGGSELITREEWARRFQSVLDQARSGNANVDDSRESIYGSRGLD